MSGVGTLCANAHYRASLYSFIVKRLSAKVGTATGFVCFSCELLSIENCSESGFEMYYGRLACFGHVILLTLVMPLFLILFSISKYLQLIFTTKSDRKSLKQLVHRIQAEISVGQKSGRPVPTFLIAGAHFSKTLTIMRAIKAVLPGKKSRIILADSKKYALNGARFSRYCDVFEVVYSDPVTKSSEYADELVKIAERNQVRLSYDFKFPYDIMI